jgi:hypothetical protein
MLSKFLKLWNSAGFEMVADIVKNRINSAVAEVIGSKTKLNRSEYEVLKYILSYFNDKIKYDDVYDKIEETKNFNFYDLLKKLNPLLPEKINIYDEFSDEYEIKVDINLLKPYKELINKKIKDYEVGLNLSNIDRDVLYEFIDKQDILQQIVSDFHEDIQTQDYSTNSFYNALTDCLSETECKNLNYSVGSCDLYNFLKDVNFE